MHISIKRILLSLLALAGLCTSCGAEGDGKVLPPQEYAAALENDSQAVVIDVRRSDEFAAGHLSGARHIDVLDEAAFAKAIALLDENRTYYIYCRSGRRSQRAARLMAGRGLKVIDLRGGFLAWQEAGMPSVTEGE